MNNTLIELENSKINTNTYLTDNGIEITQFPKDLNDFLKKVERIKIEMNRIEERNTDLQMKTDEIINHFNDKKNKVQFESLFSYLYFIFI